MAGGPARGAFLPPVESSLEKIPDGDVAELIDAAAKTGKRVYLLTTARGGIVGLRGGAGVAKAAIQKSNVLGGALLLHPNLSLGSPEPGLRRPSTIRVRRRRAAGVHPPARAIAVALGVSRRRSERIGKRRARRSSRACSLTCATGFIFALTPPRSEMDVANRLAEMLRDSVRTLKRRETR